MRGLKAAACFFIAGRPSIHAVQGVEAITRHIGEVANEQKQKAKANEVAGRHKNDGQKDHKGACKV